MLALPILPLILLIGLGVAIAFAIFLWLVLRNKAAVPPSPQQRAGAAIRQQSAKIKAAETKTVELMAQQGTLAEELRLAEHEIKKWQAVAAAAVESKNKDDVREAVKQRLGAEQRAASIKTDLNESAQALAGLQEQLRLAKETVQHSEADAAALTARLEAAKIRADLAAGAGPAQAVADLEDATVKAEGRAQANEEIGNWGKGKVSVAQMDVDAEVERLMAKEKAK
jgi:phage shock protein A